MQHFDPAQPDPLKGGSLGTALTIPQPIATLAKELLELCVRTGATDMKFYYRGQLITDLRPDAPPVVTQTASCTKSVASLAVFKLKQAGLLNIDAPLSEVASSNKIFSLPHYCLITPRHLLTHTSGLPGNDYFMPEDNARCILGDDQFHNHLAPVFDRNTRAAMHNVRHAPGEHYDYSNPGSQILEAVVREALVRGGDKRTVAQFIQTEIFDPLGMSNTTLMTEDGVTLFNGGMESTAEDLARLGHLINNRGFASDRCILLPELVDEMLSTPAFLPGARQRYGHLWIKRISIDGFMAVGDRANLVLASPKYNFVLCRTEVPRADSIAPWDPADPDANTSVIEAAKEREAAVRNGMDAAFERFLYAES